MWVDWQVIITAGAVLSAVAAFVTLMWRVFKWIDRQKAQDIKIQELEEGYKNGLDRLEKKLDGEVKSIKDAHRCDKDGIQEEQTLIVYGLLACLKGLAEQGCDGPVAKAIDKIEKHLNQKAHGQDERDVST